MGDVLSDVLKLIRLKSCVYFSRDFKSPWAMQMESGIVAQFHVVIQGPCVVKVDGVYHPVTAGDVLLFPRGYDHKLADCTGRRPVSGRDVLRSLQSGEPLFTAGETTTRLICGHYEYRHDIRHPRVASGSIR